MSGSAVAVYLRHEEYILGGLRQRYLVAVNLHDVVEVGRARLRNYDQTVAVRLEKLDEGIERVRLVAKAAVLRVLLKTAPQFGKDRIEVFQRRGALPNDAGVGAVVRPEPNFRPTGPL